MADLEYPEDLLYTSEHEWVLLREGVARVGITSYAQAALGDIVFVTLPEDGARLEAGQSCGEIESTKSVSDLYAPVSGTVTTSNQLLDTAPELVNSDPYGDGWMFEVQVAEGAAGEGLLNVHDYQARLG
jgi:glycine cleavage system H protein